MLFNYSFKQMKKFFFIHLRKWENVIILSNERLIIELVYYILVNA